MPDETSLPEPLRSQLRDELLDGERVRWCGRPLPPLKWAPLPLVVVGVLFAGLACFMATLEAGLFGHEPSWPRFAACAVFSIPGLLILSTTWKIWRRHHRAATQTFYVITDRRIVIFNAGYFGRHLLKIVLVGTVVGDLDPGLRIKSITPDQLLNHERLDRPDGSGDILLTITDEDYRNLRNGRKELLRSGFYTVADVCEPARLLNELIASSRTQK